jgi:hypothetical protein
MNRKYGGARVAKAGAPGRFAAGGVTADFHYRGDQFSFFITTPVTIPYDERTTYNLGHKATQAAAVAVQDAAMEKAGKKLADAFASGTLLTVASIKAETSKAIAVLKDYYKGKWATELEAAITRQSVAMEKLATASAKVSATIAGMKSYAAAETTSLQSFSALSNITGTANATTGVTAPVTGTQVKAGLAADLAQLRQFYNLIARMSKAGVAKSLVQQVIAMGPQPGISYAEAILSGGQALIGTLNAEEKAIGGAETKLGQEAADVQYGQSITKGFLKSLDTEQATLKKKMDALGKEIAAELGRELGVPIKDIPGLAHHAAKKPEAKKPEPKKPEHHPAVPPKVPVARPENVTINLNGSKGKLSAEEIAGIAHEIGKTMSLM